MKRDGVEKPINLCRSAWAGSQKYGALVWSGDIDSTFKSLKENINAGLNMAMSGITWWTTDIGGFHGGKIDDPEFRELIIRWFQYGVFCPVCRLHGNRVHPSHGDGYIEPISDPRNETGSDNEIWSFGEEVYKILKEQVNLRISLKDYIKKCSEDSHKEGRPMMVPLFYDYSSDENVYNVEHQFMFGSDYLVAPVVEYKARSRKVYLPSGYKWEHMHSKKIYDGGIFIEIEAPLNEIPVFKILEN